jgi:putative ABC transport system ATP-binding protein
MTGETLLVLEGLHKKRRGLEILRGVDLTVVTGEILAIVGPSGGGKSTLVRLLNRLADPDVGRILWRGDDMAGCDPLVLRRRVALVLQNPTMFEGTVRDNLLLPASYRKDSPPEEAELVRVLALCRLPAESLDRDARALSGGEQQRVNLARALVSRPEVLLLDEPTSALDRPTADHLADTLRDICRSGELTILLVTHDLRLAGRVADRIAYMEGGRILEAGPARTLLNAPQSGALKRFLGQPAVKRSEGNGGQGDY